MMAVGVIGLVITASFGGYVAGSRINSPAEVAARTSAPDPAPILVPVEQRVLSADVVTRGTGRFGSPQKLATAASALKQNPGLIAELPLAGVELGEGAVAASASGRPLFVLTGERPMSRDLGPGLSGDDVRQLEEALARLGFDVGDADGNYDERTEAGVAAWYQSNGYAAFTATPEQLAAVRAREAELAAASIEVLTATDSVSASEGVVAAARSALMTAQRRSDVTARGVARAQSEAHAADAAAATDLAARQAVLDRLRSGVTVLRGAPAEVRQARADLAAAEATAGGVRLSGQQAVAVAQAAVDRAPGLVDAATKAAAAADEAAAADVATKQAALAVVVDDPTSTAAQVAAAEADIAAARANAEIVRLAGVQSVADARQAVVDATTARDAARAQAAAADSVAASDVAAKQGVLDNLVAPVAPTPDEIANAEADLATALANSDVVRLTGERFQGEATVAADDAAADIAVKQGELAVAETALANAAAAVGSRTSTADAAALEAELARRRSGVQVPADEVVFVASTPVRVAELLVGTGDPALGGIMTVTDALVHVDAALAVEDAGLVEQGMAVQISEPDLGIETAGTVAVVAAAPGTNGVDGFHVYAEIAVDAPPTNLVGASVRITIPVESTSAEVLAVPVSALTLAPDGSSRVQRQVDGVNEFVDVHAGLSADGYVEVAAADATLQPGDLVVVGFDPGQAPSNAAATNAAAKVRPDTTAVTGG